MLARLLPRHPWRNLAVAIGLAVAAALLAGGVRDRLHPYTAEDPDTDSVRAAERLRSEGRTEPGVGLVVLIRAVDGRARMRATALELERRIEHDRHVARVDGHYSTGERALLSRDGRATYLTVRFRRLGARKRQDAAQALVERLRGPPGVTFGGRDYLAAQVNDTSAEDLRRAEAVALPIIFLLSVWFFRGFVAALLPPLVGGLSIVGSLLAIRGLSEVVDTSLFSLNIVTALGLGLAIDYSLLLVARYREELASHGPGEEALRRTLRTAGRTVAFSSVTVAAAMAALMVFPQQYLYSMGLGGAVVAVLACAIALLVVPSALALLGERINSLSPAFLKRSARAEARPDREGRWYRFASGVMRRPGRVALASALVLLALGTPFLGVRWTVGDPTVLPVGSEVRDVDRALQAEFPTNGSEPIVVVAATGSPARAADLAGRLEALPGVGRVAPPRRLSPDTSVVEVVPAGPPLSEASQRLVERIRDLPSRETLLVGGVTAGFIDLKDSTAAHLPLAIALVFATTLVALFFMTGSLVLPLKALAMNLLTVSAAFGAIVFVFQDGRLESLLDFTSRDALDISQPVLLFAVVFGLSTDYGVFLLERIREARAGGASDREAVALGLERTGRIVTAAAALFCVAIGATVTSDITFVKEVALGVSLAVVLDATLVRALLVPALMRLLGRANWWAPRRLRRLVPATR